MSFQWAKWATMLNSVDLLLKESSTKPKFEEHLYFLKKQDNLCQTLAHNIFCFALVRMLKFENGYYVNGSITIRDQLTELSIN